MKAGGIRWREVRRSAPAMVALGNFDGVHLGHARILDDLVAAGRAASLDPVIVTFDPHPRYYFKPDEKPSLLTTPEEKMALLRRWPVEVLSLAFDTELAGLEAEVFVREFLQKGVRAERFLLGHDHRFGRGARGDAALLRSMTSDPERDVVMLEPLRKDGEVISSSAIRAHLEAGRVEQANALLGHPFTYSGTVVEGDRRGRQLGFPTANLDIAYPYKAKVAHGVYAGWARRIDPSGSPDPGRPAIANIGVNPTFGGTTSKIEVHLLDFSGDLYGKTLSFELRFQVRPERKFPSLEALRGQIASDIEGVRGKIAFLAEKA